MYADSSSILRHQAADALADRFDEAQVAEPMDAWLAVFRDYAADLIREVSELPVSPAQRCR
jgi:hypothetical protein